MLSLRVFLSSALVACAAVSATPQDDSDPFSDLGGLASAFEGAVPTAIPTDINAFITAEQSVVDGILKTAPASVKSEFSAFSAKYVSLISATVEGAVSGAVATGDAGAAATDTSGMTSPTTSPTMTSGKSTSSTATSSSSTSTGKNAAATMQPALLAMAGLAAAPMLINAM